MVLPEGIQDPEDMRVRCFQLPRSLVFVQLPASSCSQQVTEVGLACLVPLNFVPAEACEQHASVLLAGLCQHSLVRYAAKCG